MKDFEIPTLQEYLKKCKNDFWDKTVAHASRKGEAPARLLKLCCGTDDYDEFVKLNTENYNYTYTKGKKFAQEQIAGSITHIKIAIDRLEESKKNHDNAMSQTTNQEEKQLDDVERNIRKTTGNKKIF